MGRRLVAWVHAHRGDGTSQAFGPGDEPPAWAAQQITNPKAWDSDDEDGDTVEIPVPAPPPPAVWPVPRKGPLATRKAWAELAHALGVDHRAEASRDEIIAAVDATR